MKNGFHEFVRTRFPSLQFTFSLFLLAFDFSISKFLFSFPFSISNNSDFSSVTVLLWWYCFWVYPVIQYYVKTVPLVFHGPGDNFLFSFADVYVITSVVYLINNGRAAWEYFWLILKYLSLLDYVWKWGWLLYQVFLWTLVQAIAPMTISVFSHSQLSLFPFFTQTLFYIFWLLFLILKHCIHFMLQPLYSISWSKCFFAQMPCAHNKNPLNTGILRKYERSDPTEHCLQCQGQSKGINTQKISIENYHRWNIRELL